MLFFGSLEVFELFVVLRDLEVLGLSLVLKVSVIWRFIRRGLTSSATDVYLGDEEGFFKLIASSLTLSSFSLLARDLLVDI